MQRLLKISFDQALLSLTPILSWFLLSLLVDKNLINVFSIIYPLQMLYGVIRSPFSTGANISRVRDKNKHAVMSGLVLGIIVTILIYGAVLLNVDNYINFMNVDSANRLFIIYAIAYLMLQTIFSFVLDKLYYTGRNTRANRYSTLYNLVSFISLIGTALLTKNQLLIVSVSLTVTGVLTLFALITNWNKFKFRLNLFHCIKYDSVTLSSYIISFFVFLFGISNTLEFSPQYALAMTFASLITDMQWDTFDSVATAAKIDVSKGKFNFKKSLRNAYKLVILLFASTGIMFFSLFWFYELDLTLVLIYLSFEIITFLLDPAQYLYTNYLQLNWSPSKTTANKITSRLIRLGLSLMPSPFCTGIGEVGCAAYQLISTRVMFNRHFRIDKSGKVIKRRARRKYLARRYRYDDLPIDKT